MNDPLDELLAALQGPATEAELRGSDAAVDAMHHALLEELETAMTPPASARPRLRPRRTQVVTLVAAGVLGFAGVAAAGPGGFFTEDEPAPTTTVEPSTTVPETTVPETTVPETTVPETTVPETTVPAAAAPETTESTLVDDPDTEFDETECAEGNHGRTVSSVAHESKPGPGHGDDVSEAAQSSCGKDGADDDATESTVEDDEDDDDATESTVEDDEDDATESTVDHSDDSGPGNSNGHGNSGQGGSNGQGNSGHGGSDD